MALTVEDGTGVYAAQSYATVAYIDAYWGGQTHTAFFTAWDAATTAVKEGAAREASRYLDARLARAYRGYRAGYTQGLEWPRSGARDDAGFELPNLPPQLQDAVAELAGRAVSARLSEDQDVTGAIKRARDKVGPIETETEYAGSASQEKKFGAVMASLAPILNGSQPGAGPTWGFI